MAAYLSHATLELQPVSLIAKDAFTVNGQLYPPITTLVKKLAQLGLDLELDVSTFDFASVRMRYDVVEQEISNSLGNSCVWCFSCDASFPRPQRPIRVRHQQCLWWRWRRIVRRVCSRGCSRQHTPFLWGLVSARLRSLISIDLGCAMLDRAVYNRVGMLEMLMFMLNRLGPDRWSRVFSWLLCSLGRMRYCRGRGLGWLGTAIGRFLERRRTHFSSFQLLEF